MLALAKREQFLDLRQRKAQLLSVSHKGEVANLLFAEQPVSTCASRCGWNQALPLVKADRVYAHSRQLPSLAYVDGPFHHDQNKPLS